MVTGTAAATPRKASSIAATIGALFSSSCVVGILLIPLGLGSVMASGLFKFFDDYRFIFMAITLAFLVSAHVISRRAGGANARFLWIITIIAVAFIAAEIIVDPPWDRHALVPM